MPKELKRLPSYRVEIKNLNSFADLKEALEDEIKRQISIYESGKIPISETRRFISKKRRRRF